MAQRPIVRARLLAGLIVGLSIQLAQPQADAAEAVPEQIQQLLRTRQYSEALPMLQTLASTGHIGALTLLANLYSSGQGVPRDRDKSLQYLSRAAELGDGESQFYLGKLLVGSTRSKTEYEAGLSWLKKAAAQGHPGAESLYNSAVTNKHKFAKSSDKDQGRSTSAPTSEYIISLAERGDLEQLRKEFANNPDINRKDQHGRTALSAAVEANRNKTVEFLLSKHADPNIRLAGNNTPLLLAVKAERPVLAKLLLAAHAEVEVKDNSGNTALLYAVKNKNMEIVRLLLTYSANVNAVDGDDWSVLDVARASGDKTIHELLTNAGAKARLAELQQHKRTALLLNRPSGQNQNGQLLFDAISQSNHELLRHLLEAAVDLSARDGLGRTPLALAVQTGDRFAIQLLLARGASLSASDEHGLTPLHYAIDKGSIEILETLLKTGEVKTTTQRHSVLLYAIKSGHTALALSLLAHGFAPVINSAESEDIIVAAVRHNAVSVLRAFVSAGLDPAQYEDKEGHSLFWHAVHAHQRTAAAFLQKYGAKPPLSASESSELLVNAARTSDPALLRLVVAAGADINARSAGGTTALMTAATTGCLDCITYLIEQGANINDRDDMGNTALHIAALNGKQEIVKKLTGSGADPRIVNNAGESYSSITER